MYLAGRLQIKELICTGTPQETTSLRSWRHNHWGLLWSACERQRSV